MARRRHPDRTRSVNTCVIALTLALVAAPIARGAETSEAESVEPLLYRIFLNQTGGQSLVSYGAYARVRDRLIFSLPRLSEPMTGPGPLVSIPASRVDWRTTTRYAYSARYDRQATARADASPEAIRSSGSPVRLSMMPPPDAQELVTQALTVARLTSVPAEKLSVLEGAIAMMDRPDARLPDDWRLATRASAARELAAELETSSAYASLEATAIARATALAAQADVRGIRAVIDDLTAEDVLLGSRRPNEVTAIMTVVDQQLQAAQALRLARDHWQVRVEVYRDYRAEVASYVERFAEERAFLDDVRWLAGPDPGALEGLMARLQRVAESFAGLTPPDDVSEVHALYRQAFGLAIQSVTGRRRAVDSGDLDRARDAGAAAAGALLLFDRATQELERTLHPPELN